jgi:hypothetical protein
LEEGIRKGIRWGGGLDFAAPVGVFSNDDFHARRDERLGVPLGRIVGRLTGRVRQPWESSFGWRFAVDGLDESMILVDADAVASTLTDAAALDECP